MKTTITIRHDIRVCPLRHVGGDRSIAEAAWVCEPDDARGDDVGAVGKVIGAMMKGRHGTPFEHASLTFHVEAPIFVFREWHRHRIGFSYNEVSARYRVVEPEFYVPSPEGTRPIREPDGFRPMRPVLADGTDADASILHSRTAVAYRAAWDAYAAMIEAGIAREVARNVLPVGLYSAMHVTCNPRSLMVFLSLRTRDERAAVPSYPLWEIDAAARQMEAQFASLFPLTYAAFIANGRVAP